MMFWRRAEFLKYLSCKTDAADGLIYQLLLPIFSSSYNNEGE